MWHISKLFVNGLAKYKSYKKNIQNYVFYRIIDNSTYKRYILQCINKTDIFYISLPEIVDDTYILSRLSPIQACQVGIDYVNYLIKMNNSTTQLKTNQKKFKYFNKASSGHYQLQYELRMGQLQFIDIVTSRTYVMEPQEIVSSKYIQLFNAEQAFQIGLRIGLKLNRKVNNQVIH